MKQLFLFLLLLTLFNCTKFTKHRTPASTVQTYQQLINELEDVAKSPFVSTEQCKNVMGNYFQKLLKAPYNSNHLAEMTDGEIEHIVNQTFKIRLSIQERLQELGFEGRFNKDCLNQIDRLNLSMRYIEDSIILEYYRRKEYINDEYEKVIAYEEENLQGMFPQLITNPKFGEFKNVNDLKTGDIILTRAKTFGSATIARVGTRDNQFSHLSIVYKDDHGKLFTIESLIEHGLIIAPLKKHLKRKHARSVVFRFKDAEIGKRAGEYIYQHAKNLLSQHKKVPYDFSMDYKKHDRYFCSEIIYHAYEGATDGKVLVPYYKSKVHKKLIPFLRNIGVAVDESNFEKFDLFSPGDIQYDHRFEIVTEWRNPKHIDDLRIKDAILTRMFYWMEDNDYKFHVTKGSTTAAKVAKIVRATPLLGLAVKNLYPRKMDLDTMTTFLTVDKAAKKLQKEILKVEKKANRKLSFYELFNNLNRIREEDYQRWKAGKKSIFHKYFHP